MNCWSVIWLHFKFTELFLPSSFGSSGNGFQLQNESRTMMGLPEPVTNPGPGCQPPYAAFGIKKSYNFEKTHPILKPAALIIEKFGT